MECPYCKQEMKPGHLEGDGRRNVRWYEEGKRIGVGDKLAGTGVLQATQYSWGKFKISGEYCKRCKKLLIDTEISE